MVIRHRNLCSLSISTTKVITRMCQSCGCFDCLDGALYAMPDFDPEIPPLQFYDDDDDEAFEEDDDQPDEGLIKPLEAELGCECAKCTRCLCRSIDAEDNDEPDEEYTTGLIYS